MGTGLVGEGGEAEVALEIPSALSLLRDITRIHSV